MRKKNGASDQSGTICQNGSTAEPSSKKWLKMVPPFQNGTTLQSGTKMVPFLEVEIKWLLLSKWSHNQLFFFGKNGTPKQSGTKMVLKGGHPVDMKIFFRRGVSPIWGFMALP